jgi:rubrerythrin
MERLTTNDTRSYIPALNQIALTEYRAYEFYLAWAQATKDKDVERVMRIVAIRELEHASAFQQRIFELGDLPLDGPHDFGPQCDEWLHLFKSDASDLDKFRGFGFEDPHRLPQDNFHDLFLDCTLDSETGALLGRYIAEERESANMFLEVYARLLERELADEHDTQSATAL